jgi:hypothetical protein
MSAAASTAELRRAVEQWARARGLWSHHNNPAPRGWRITASDGGVAMLVLHQPPSIHDPAPYWTISPVIALAWALLVESGAESVSVGRCPACRGRGEWSWWDRGWQPEFATWAVQDGELGEIRVVRPGGPWPLGCRLRNEISGFPDERRRAASATARPAQPAASSATLTQPRPSLNLPQRGSD